MRDDVEMADGLRGAEVFRSLTQQAGMTIRELTDLVEAHGRDAAIKIAVGRVVERRSRGRHLVAARRRLVEHYESMW
jgi:hypothetical protein